MNKVKITLNIEPDKIQQLFDNALGGCYSGWISEMNVDIKHLKSSLIIFSSKNDKEGEFSGKKKPLRWDDIKRGLELMAINSPHDFANILKDEMDAETSDVFLQFTLLGEEIYG